MNASSPTTAASLLLPPRPRLVLRVGFAGSQSLVTDDELAAIPLPEGAEEREKERERRVRVVAERERLVRALPVVLDAIGSPLVGLVPLEESKGRAGTRVSAFFARRCPLLRLVTGLCEGADAIAGRTLETIRAASGVESAGPPDPSCLETELAAVLPFDVETYRRSRPVTFRAEFDRQLQRCAWVLELDGIYEKPQRDTAQAAMRRSRAYRAQAAFLLRHSDVLIAATNADEPSKAGGTLETVRDALAFGLPVVLIHTGRDGDNVLLINPEDDLHSVLAQLPPTAKEWQQRLQEWITQITADPDNGLDSDDHTHQDAHEQGEALLREYFDEPLSPPRDIRGKRKPGYRERAWSWLESRFRVGPGSKGDDPLKPYGDYRKRATDLNYHYSGQYRGAFVLNYAAAIVAVVLAALSLTLLGTADHTAGVKQIAVLLEVAGQVQKEPVVASAPSPWLLPLLFTLALFKLGIVFFISRNTRRANQEHWNERAVNYRYLAERLRAMFYLPLAGSHQPPAADPPQFASRAIRQSAVDWLFDSLVRAISPADMPHASRRVFPANEEHGELAVQKLLTLEPKETAVKIRDAWIGEQAKYHERTFRTMHAMHHVMEKVGTRLAWTVIGVVALDVLLLSGKVLHWLPESWVPFAKVATPWLIFTSAVLPAIVAALGGMRFQSECQRLAERSAVMRVLLDKPGNTKSNKPGGRKEIAQVLVARLAASQSDPAHDPGSWSHGVLRLAESTATVFVQEAAEWTVLYAKEVNDPG